MNNHKYSIGDKVRLDYDRNYIHEVMEILDNCVGEQVLMVKPIEGEGHAFKISSHDLHPYDIEADQAMAIEVQMLIDTATHSLEAAFEAWRAAKEKYSENSPSYSMQGDDLLDMSKFEAVFERNGWSTSSLYC